MVKLRLVAADTAAADDDYAVVDEAVVEVITAAAAGVVVAADDVVAEHLAETGHKDDWAMYRGWEKHCAENWESGWNKYSEGKHCLGNQAKHSNGLETGAPLILVSGTVSQSAMMAGTGHFLHIISARKIHYSILTKIC